MPKTLITLAGGKGSHIMITGNEEKLRSHLETLPDRSLTPEELFRISYRMNDGDLYKSLLTVENVLSDQWRNPKRDKLTTTAKLIPFSNTFGSDGDVFGHWYHLFGITFFGSVEGKTMAQIAAKAEDIGSLILSDFKGERQENRINDKGAVAGALLKRYASAKIKGETIRMPASSNKTKKEDLQALVEKEVAKILKEESAGK